MLFSDKADPGSVPMAGVWNQPDTADHHDAPQLNAQIVNNLLSPNQQAAADNSGTEDAGLQGGTLLVPVAKSKALKAARPISIGLAGTN